MKDNNFDCFVKLGNEKLAKKTLVFNMNTSTDCIGQKLGLCNLGSKCYGLRIEKRYPNSLKHHKDQKKYWNENSKEDLAKNFLYYCSIFDVEFIRFNEVGEFENQNDVDKLIYISNYLLKNGSDVIVYGYTSRSDLNFDTRPKNLVINGSGFMLDNNFTVTTDVNKVNCIAYEVKLKNKELKKQGIKKQVKHYCGDKCQLCMEKNNKVIYEKLH